MLKLRTQLPFHESDWQISHSDKILGVGSCFTQHIGKYLEDYKFSCLTNPHGIIFNPISIADCLDAMLLNQQINITALLNHRNLYHSLQHHSSFSSSDPDITISGINQSTQRGNQFLKQSRFLILTFGTAYVYVFNKSRQIVANCHKLPQNQFSKKLLTVTSIVNRLKEVLTTLRTQNPHLRVILTVSPVRHIKDGMINNQKSKATLLLATHDLVDQLEFVHYFPSYEILMDDLRDYRFYKDDLLHPNQLAVKYIWEHFKQTYFDSDTSNLLVEIEKIAQAYRHRPLQPASEAHQLFLRQQLEKTHLLATQFPHLSFTREINHFLNGVQNKPQDLMV